MGRRIRAYVALYNLLHDWRDGEDDWLDGVQAGDDLGNSAMQRQLHGNETNRVSGGSFTGCFEVGECSDDESVCCV